MSIKKRFNFRLRLLPAMAFGALILLLVDASPYTVTAGDYQNIPLKAGEVVYDLICGVKASANLYIAIWAALTMGYLLAIGQMKIKKTKFYIPMAVYLGMVLLSFAFSDYKEVAWLGCVNRLEGTRTIICYIFMLFYIINVIDDVRDAYYIIAGVMFGAFLACLIGLLQFLGYDVLYEFFSSKQSLMGMEVSTKFSSGEVYQTVGNMNYVGMYLSLIIPLLICIIMNAGKYPMFLSENGRTIRKNHMVSIDKKYVYILTIASIVFLLLIVINIYGAGSLGGLVAIVADVLFVIIMLQNRTWKRITVGVVAVIGLIIAGVILYSRGTDTHKVIDYFETGKDCLTMSMNGNEINVYYNRNTGEYEVKDGYKKPLNVFSFEGEDGIYQIEDDRFGGELIITPIDNGFDPYVLMDVRDEEFLFHYTDEGVKYVNSLGNEVVLSTVKSIGFSNHLSAGSGRGYIWSRTIPLLKKSVLIGSGADTFMFDFPQDDYAGKYSLGMGLLLVTDKPHNMYLMMGVCTGWISLIAFLCMIWMFIARVYEIVIDNNDIRSRVILVYIAAGIVGFLIDGMFNDSSVCIMPAFYCMLGVGMGLVTISLKGQRKEI